MTPEDLEMMKVIRGAICEKAHIIHWYDILALMIVGYWIGNTITGFWWAL